MHINKELVFWLSALACLRFVHPTAMNINLCFFEWVGIPFCPGHGLGHSLHYLLNGEVFRSFDFHWMGIPVLATLILRIVQLLKYEILLKKGIDINLKYL